MSRDPLILAARRVSTSFDAPVAICVIIHKDCRIQTASWGQTMRDCAAGKVLGGIAHAALIQHMERVQAVAEAEASGALPPAKQDDLAWAAKGSDMPARLDHSLGFVAVCECCQRQAGDGLEIHFHHGLGVALCTCCLQETPRDFLDARMRQVMAGGRALAAPPAGVRA